MVSTTIMDRCQRTRPPYAASEQEIVNAFLDWQRATLLCKLEGLADEELRRQHQPSGMTLLGIVKHLADVERSWFREVFAGEDLAGAWDPNDPDRYWRIEPDEITEDVIAFYQTEVERARDIVASAGLGDSAKNAQPRDAGLTLRWILVHMIQETARHNGHADLLREAIDGQTGP